MVDRLEWIAPDGTIFRSPQHEEEEEGRSGILDRRRRVILEIAEGDPEW